jgi:hypothetical protein
MNLSERRRLFLLGLCLTATLAVAAVSGIDQESDVAGESLAAREKGAPGSKVGSALAMVSREPLETVEADIFAARTWQPAPPPPSQASAPVVTRPTIPSLPFVYAGQLSDLQSGKLIAYLTRSDTVYAASAGDVIDETYRLEAISDKQITFIYLPMKAQQTLAIPGN